MFLCYVDESGTPQIPGNTSHYILAGLAVPVHLWPKYDSDIRTIKKKYQLQGYEIHVAWILRRYFEQNKIPGFESLNTKQRQAEVRKYRNQYLLELQKKSKANLYHQMKKNYRKTDEYIHLTYQQRVNFIFELAQQVSRWTSARLFAECIDKIFYDPFRSTDSIDEQAFEQVVSRFEKYLKVINTTHQKNYGLIIHDNNDTVSKKHTQMMKKFREKGTLWTNVSNIIETPLFVDSQLTSMVQIADLCSYSIRRYLENEEDELFRLIFKRADRKDGKTVGVRHFTHSNCDCLICKSHK